VILAVANVAAQKPMASHESTRPRGEAATVAARVNGVPIGSAEVQAAIDARLPLASDQQDISPEKRAVMRREALEGLIDGELRYQEALRLRVRVMPQEIEQALERARQAYRGGPEAFERALRESGTTVEQLRSSMLRGLMIKKVYEQAVGHGCRVSETDASAYYRDNRQRFVIPEQRRPHLITIGVDRSASRTQQERARQDAQGLGRRIAAGESLEQLARQHSSDPSSANGGDLGFVHRGRLMDELESALKTMKPGQVSQVIQTIEGFHLLRLAEVRPATQQSFAEVKDQLVRDLTETRCADATARWSKRLRDVARVDHPGG
jgi:parvulin-like peptidyl-prolyl isomerase